jgi:two-component system LytT family response regulator
MRKSINCIIVDDEPMAREILATHLQKIDFVTIVGSCKNAMEAFTVLNSETIDLVFLDINMPEVSGLSLAKSIDKSTKIIFTTAYREYAVDGFNLEAVDYLLKPISFERLLQALNKLNRNELTASVTAENEKTEKNDFIFVRSDRKMVKVDFSAIVYIESLSDYIKIHLHDKTIITRETISNIEAKLPAHSFLRTHRSFIISIAKITSFTNEFIEIHTKAIPISRTYRGAVLNKLETM